MLGSVCIYLLVLPTRVQMYVAPQILRFVHVPVTIVDTFIIIIIFKAG